MDINDYIVFPTNTYTHSGPIKEITSQRALSAFAVAPSQTSSKLGELRKHGIQAATFRAPGEIENVGVATFRGEIFSDETQSGRRLPSNLDVELEPRFIEWHNDHTATVDYRVADNHPSEIKSVVISYARNNGVLGRLGHVEFARKTVLLDRLYESDTAASSQYATYSIKVGQAEEDIECGTPDGCRRARSLPAIGALPATIRLSVTLEDNHRFTARNSRELHAQYFVDTTNIALKRIGQPTKLILADSDVLMHAIVREAGPNKACYQSNTAEASYDRARQTLTFVHEIGHLLGAPHSTLLDNVMSLEGLLRRKLTFDENAKQCLRG